MGGVISLTSPKLGDNELLRKFAGLEPITDNDPFWNQLLSFNIKLDERNSKIFLWQTGNALLVLRFVCKFFAQRLNEAEFVKIFAKNILNDDGKLENTSDYEEPFQNTAEEFINSLVEIVVDVPVNESTMSVHMESVKCLLSILSFQLYNETVQGYSPFYGYLMNGRCSIHAPLFTKALLRNYLQHNTPFKDPNAQSSGSFVVDLAANFWSVMQLATGGGGGGESVDQENVKLSTVDVTLGGLCITLVLNLACHQPPEGAPRNPFRETLAAFHNSQEVSNLSTATTQSVATFKLDYSALYDRLCCTVTEEPPMLLLYLLLHRNVGFRNFVLSRVNLENLVLPVLKVLHYGQQAKESIHGPAFNSHHVYLALIIVLILSEDDFFCKIIHETTVRNIDWYQGDRHVVNDISLGGLIILVLVRTIQYNTIKTRDRYLHTNCLAALANMSTYFKHLSATVCQKLVGLLEVLTKRHLKLVDHIRLSAQYDINQEATEGQNQNYQQDISALEEGIRTLLEIINSTLTNGLRHNPHLIYTILYKRELFDSFQNHPMFQDLIWNISAVINHFATRVQSLEKGSTVSQVLDIIEKGALQWPTDRLKKFPELKFRYVEDDNTVEFFVPYVWRLIYKHSSLYWDPTKVKLFNALGIFQIP